MDNSVNNNNSRVARPTNSVMSWIWRGIDHITGKDEIDKLTFRTVLDNLAAHYESHPPPQPVDGFNSLPREILERILDFAEWDDIGSLLLACKYDHWVGAQYLDGVLRKYKIEVDHLGDRPPGGLYHVISLGRARRRADEVWKSAPFLRANFNERLKLLSEACNAIQGILAEGLTQVQSAFIPEGYYPYQDPNGGPPVTDLPGPYELDPVYVAMSPDVISRYFPNQNYDHFLIGHYIKRRAAGQNAVPAMEIFDAMWMLQALRRQIRNVENYQDWPEGLRWGRRFRTPEVSNTEEGNPGPEAENQIPWNIEQHL